MKRLLCHLFSYNNQPRCLPYDTSDHVISPNKFPLCVRCLLPLSWGLANKAFWVCDLFKGGFPGWSISLIYHHPSPFYWMRHKNQPPSQLLLGEPWYHLLWKYLPVLLPLEIPLNCWYFLFIFVRSIINPLPVIWVTFTLCVVPME